MDDDGVSLFWLGVSIFLLVALVYPWYSYWVVTHLLARDAEAAVAELDSQMKVAQQRAQQVAAEQQAAAQERQRRSYAAAVRVMGISPSGDRPTVLVDFGRSNVVDAGDVICVQAARWLHRDLSGQVITLQRYRGDQPAMSAGDLACE